jgi:hypothetical protein
MIYDIKKAYYKLNCFINHCIAALIINIQKFMAKKWEIKANEYLERA